MNNAAIIDAVGLGFADPVVDSQGTFRLVLDAISHPGRVATVRGGTPAENRSGLSDAAAAVALTLLDHETPVWLDIALPSAGEFLRFHCGSPLVGTPGACRFAFLVHGMSLPPLAAFDLGTPDYPERSTTVVIEVSGLVDGSGLTLSGPGIKTSTLLGVGGLRAEFWRARRDLAPLFPLGIDLILTCGRRLAVIPRTTVVEA